MGRDFDLVIQKVESFAGRIEEAGRGRIVAAFGLDPVEDAPRRAALAAMAIRKALSRASQSPVGSAVPTRIAIHADHCPVRDVNGRAQIDGEAKRRMIEVLTELAAHAEPDSMRVSAGARSLLGRRFDVAEAAGHAEATTSAGRLLGYHKHRFGVGGQPGPFVGRDLELDTLGKRWRDTREGGGQVVALVGEPGIGKSRLLYEFQRTLDSSEVIHLEGHGESYGGGIPYLPVIDLLKAYFHVDEREEPAAIGQRMAARLHALDMVDVSPLLALLEAPCVDPEWQALEPAQRRSRTLEALTGFVLRLGHIRPVLLAVEDLHWIDTETQAFLDRMVVSLPAARVLLLVTYRPEYGHGWGGKSSYAQLRLDPLAPPSAEALVRNLVGDDVTLEPLTRCVVARSEGNPFFLEESVRTLIETHGLVGERGAYRPARDAQVVAVPPTVRAVLAARIDRLPSEERELLQAAAVVGKDVPLALLQAIVDVPEATLHRALTVLQSSEFLHETSRFPEIEYTFKHALTHEVAYGALLPERRRALHSRMVEALERLYADRLAEQVDRLAHHALAAEAWSEALTYCRQAGTKAAWRSAHREAVRDFEHALRAIRQLPETRATLEERLDLHRQLRWSLVALGQYGKLAESLRDAEGLAEALGDRYRLGEISVIMARFRAAIGDHDGAVNAGQRARAIGTALGDRALEIRAAYQLGGVYRQTGDYDKAISEYRMVVDSLGGELIQERFGEPSVLSVHARTWLATSLAEVGRFSEGIAIGEEALRIADETDNLYSVTNAHIGLGTLHLRQGGVDRAIQLLERAVSLSRDGNSLVQLSQSMSALGACLTLAGRVEEALSLLELALETAAATGSMASHSLCMARLAEGKLLAGHTREASELATRTLDATRTYKERGQEAWVRHVLGEIAARDDVPGLATAKRYYGEAMALALSLGMRPLRARCHAELGMLYRQMGEHDQAAEHLTRAATMFREMGMHFWLKQAERALEERPHD
jgi:predicted ATPase